MNKPPRKSLPKTVKKKSSQRKTPIKYYFLGFFALLFLVLFWYRHKIEMYGWLAYNDWKNEGKVLKIPISEKKKINFIVNAYSGNLFGVDISQYQGTINWDALGKINNSAPISYAFVRATMGTQRNDITFPLFWKKLKEKKIIRGAYHFYDPNASSTEQANHFIATVKLEKGDLPPILDIEKTSRIQDAEQLKIGIKNWLELVEAHYGVKPIVYSYDKFFAHELNGFETNDYVVWAANYNFIPHPEKQDWQFWQFSDQGVVEGIKDNYVDLNVFNGGSWALNGLLVD